MPHCKNCDLEFTTQGLHFHMRSCKGNTWTAWIWTILGWLNWEPSLSSTFWKLLQFCVILTVVETLYGLEKFTLPLVIHGVYRTFTEGNPYAFGHLFWVQSVCTGVYSAPCRNEKYWFKKDGKVDSGKIEMVG